MKIVFMGTPEFAVPTLEALVSEGHSIPGVVTQPDRPKGRGRQISASPVKQFAQQAGLTVLQPETASDPEFIRTLKDLEPDLIVVVAFGQILKPGVLEIPKYFCVNLHSSLLPKYRGAAPINRAIINGDKISGVTTMKMDPGMDTGAILLMREIPIEDSDDAQTLHDKLKNEGASLVVETVRRLERGDLTPNPQDSSQATLAPKLKKQEGSIDWERDADAIRNLVRGLTPWPGAFTFLGNQRLKLLRVETAGGGSAAPGAVARVSPYGIEIETGKDRIVVT